MERLERSRPILYGVALVALVLIFATPNPYQRVALGFVAVLMGSINGLRGTLVASSMAGILLHLSGRIYSCPFESPGVFFLVAAFSLGAIATGWLVDRYSALLSGSESGRWDMRLQRDRLDITLDSIADAVIATDENGYVSYLNPVAEGLTGWPEAEAVGMHIDEVFRIVSEHTGEPAANPVNRVLAEGVTVGLANHTLLIRRDGSEIPIDDSAAPKVDRRGAVLGAVLVFRDISDKRRAEKEREALLADLAERNKELQLLHRSARLMRDVSLPVPDMLREIIALLGTFTRYPEHTSVRISLGEEIYESPGHLPSPDPIGVDFETVHGEVGRIELGYSEDSPHTTFLDEEIETLGALAEMLRTTIQDRRSRSALRESERRLRATLKGIGDAVIATDTRGRVELVNDRAEEMIGWSEREAEGLPLGDILRLYREGDSEQVSDPLGAVLHSSYGFLSSAKYTLITGQGKSLPVEYSVAPIVEVDGRVTGAIMVLRDVSRRTRIERRLAASERKFRRFVERANDLIVSLDSDGTFTYVSPNLTSRLGYETADFIGAPVEAFVHPDDLRGLTDSLDEHRSGSEERPSVMEIRVRHVSGQWRWFSVSISADPRSEEAAFSIIARDVTERRIVEDALRESEERFRQLADSIHEVFWLRDAGGFLYINPAFERVWDRSVDEAYRDPGVVLESVHVDDRERVARMMESAIHRERGRMEIEFRIVRPDGTVRWIWLRTSPVLSDTGDTFRVAAVATDATEARKTRESLRRREMELSALLENTPDVITRFDTSFRRLYANQAVERLFEIPREAYADGSNSDLGMEAEVVIQWRTASRYVFKTGEGTSFDWHMLTSSGIRYFNTRLIPEFHRDGRVGSVLSVSRDITEQKLAEENLRHLSHHDQLTGLYNRSFFDVELERLDAPRQLPLSIVIADLNGLKLVNDAFGHLEGDRLLKRVAELLGAHFRSEDIVARWGGDEFAVILPRTSAKEVEEISERLRRAIAHEGMMDDALRISVSIGHDTKVDASTDMQEVLRTAEERMYRNKLLESESARSSLLASLEGSLRETHLETEEHAQRLGRLAAELGRSMDLAADQIHELRLLARLHDIGKISIPASTLLKDGPLEDDEWQSVERHPEVGYRIVRSVPDLAPIAEAILSHHEWWNGDGYPRGLRGEEIPLTARILAVVDAYDVMTSGRPYRSAISHEESMRELRRCAGSQFDPYVVDAFESMMLSQHG